MSQAGFTKVHMEQSPKGRDYQLDQGGVRPVAGVLPKGTCEADFGADADLHCSQLLSRSQSPSRCRAATSPVRGGAPFSKRQNAIQDGIGTSIVSFVTKPEVAWVQMGIMSRMTTWPSP